MMWLTEGLFLVHASYLQRILQFVVLACAVLFLLLLLHLPLLLLLMLLLPCLSRFQPVFLTFLLTLQVASRWARSPPCWAARLCSSWRRSVEVCKLCSRTATRSSEVLVLFLKIIQLQLWGKTWLTFYTCLCLCDLIWIPIYFLDLRWFSGRRTSAHQRLARREVLPDQDQDQEKTCCRWSYENPTLLVLPTPSSALPPAGRTLCLCSRSRRPPSLNQTFEEDQKWFLMVTYCSLTASEII